MCIVYSYRDKINNVVAFIYNVTAVGGTTVTSDRPLCTASFWRPCWSCAMFVIRVRKQVSTLSCSRLTIHSNHLFTELAFLPYVDLSSEDAGTLPKLDDGDSGAITLPSQLPFKQSNQTTAFVSVNGSQLINR